MEAYQKLFETFRNYIQACKSINSLLLDSRAAGELIDLDHRDFVKEFEKAPEFRELIKDVSTNEKTGKLGWEWVPERRSLNGRYTICGPTYLRNFFENKEIYQKIRYEKPLDVNEDFDTFLEETEKEIEVTHGGTMLGLAMEFGEQKQIDFGEFSIKNLDEKDPDFVTNPYIVNKTTVQEPDSTGDLREKFLALEFVINLYFTNPMFITLNYESNSLFSKFYNTHNIYEAATSSYDYSEELMALIRSRLRKVGPITDGVVEEQEDDRDFVEETGVNSDRFEELQTMAEEEGGKYEDAYVDFLEKAEKYFVKRDLLGNWLPRTDILKFKEFINKVWEFMQSEAYNKQEYIKIAVAFFKNSFKNLPEVEDTVESSSLVNIINYVTALEALYCEGEAELREKLSNRVSNLIGREESQKGHIRESLLEIYKIRSKYLHGSSVTIDRSFREGFEIKKDNKTSRSLEIWLRDIVRRSILSLFSLCRHYPSKTRREELRNKLSNPYGQIHDIQHRASEFLSLCSKAEVRGL